LEVDLTGPGFHHDRRDRLVIESKESMKKRGLASPDDGDALALTFAMPVVVKRIDQATYRLGGFKEGSWMS
jgi:phage terminase large subunit